VELTLTTPTRCVQEDIARALRLAQRVLHGAEVTTLKTLADQYLASVKPRITVAGYEAKQRHIQALLDRAADASIGNHEPTLLTGSCARRTSTA
jgi:hypothetical protein